MQPPKLLSSNACALQPSKSETPKLSMEVQAQLTADMYGVACAPADVHVKSELLWRLAAVLRAVQSWWAAAGKQARGTALQSSLVTAQHELLAVSGLLKAE